jgi:hypothetical protein
MAWRGLKGRAQYRELNRGARYCMERMAASGRDASVREAAFVIAVEAAAIKVRGFVRDAPRR